MIRHFFLLMAFVFGVLTTIVPTSWLSFAYSTTKRSFLMLALPDEQEEYCFQSERTTFDNSTISARF
ncbi:unnamed protein product, partial [Mesorhabditis belari]|uniref:Secreted protein n=1 Tax=Mesorhabditis belari TaxID=2138241 RepID=A0AAF3ESR4_9BILA